MPDLDLSNWTWDQVKESYPDLYAKYGPGSTATGTTPSPATTPAAPNPVVATGAGVPPAGTPFGPDTIIDYWGGPTQPVPSNLPGQTTTNPTPYGEVPQVPDPSATLLQALGGDLNALQQLFNLAGQTNQFNIGQSVAPYMANLPGYQSMREQQSQNIGSLLKGEVPSDVWAQLAQKAAERGVAMGSPGSPNANAALLAALGRSSLDLQQQGVQNLATAIQETPVPKLWDPSQFFVTPEQQQAAQAAANIYAAAPDPALAQQAAEEAVNRGAKAGGLGTGGAITGPVGAPSSGFTPPTPIPRGGTSAFGPSTGTSPWSLWPTHTEPTAPAAPSPGWTPSNANLIGGGGERLPTGALAWEWDPTMGAYVNTSTGELSDTPGGFSGVWGNYDEANMPATEEYVGAPAWNWDDDFGAYINDQTGEISDLPDGSQPWGQTVQDFQTPAGETVPEDQNFYNAYDDYFYDDTMATSPDLTFDDSYYDPYAAESSYDYYE